MIELLVNIAIILTSLSEYIYTQRENFWIFCRETSIKITVLSSDRDARPRTELKVYCTPSKITVLVQ